MEGKTVYLIISVTSPPRPERFPMVRAYGVTIQGGLPSYSKDGSSGQWEIAIAQ